MDWYEPVIRVSTLFQRRIVTAQQREDEVVMSVHVHTLVLFLCGDI